MGISQKIANLILDFKIQDPRPINELRKELSNSSTQVKAMKTIVSMLQQNYDSNLLLGDIIKIIDTNNYELKVLCSFYLRNTCFNRPACQLMCTHTFLKDFNDCNYKIQQLAVIDSIYLSDEILMKNYVKDLLRMCSHPKEEIRMLSARSLSLYYLKNRKLFFEKNLLKNLKFLLEDENEDVIISALKAISVIESREHVVDHKLILKIAYNFYERGNNNGLRWALNVLKYIKVDENIYKLIIKTVKSNDIGIFYLSSKKLLEHGENHQMIFNIATEFLNVRPEHLYNLLIFIYSIIENVEIDIFDFFINNSVDEINILKAKILLKKYNKMSPKDQNIVLSNILQYINSNEHFTEEILKEMIIENNYLPEIVDKVIPTDLILNCIFKYKKMLNNSKWKKAISSMLFNIKETKIQEIYITLVSEFCDQVPNLVYKLENEELCLQLVKMYVVMLQRNKIKSDECIKHLKRIQKKFKMIKRTGIVINNLENIDPENILFEELKINKEDENLISVDFSLNYKSKDDLKMVEDISKSESMEINDSVIDNNDSINKKEQNLNANKIDINKNKDVSFERFPVFIDLVDFKGLLDIERNKLILTVDILERPQLLRYSVDFDGIIEQENEISLEGRYTLFEITPEFINRKYKIILGEFKFESIFNINLLVQPNKCTSKQYENEIKLFEESLKVDWEIFESLNLFKIDSERYSGNILGHKIFIKKINNQAEIKGDEFINEIFKK